VGLIDFAAGYALGGKAGNEGFDEVVAAAKEVIHSKEFQALVSAGRNHAGATLRQLGDLVEGGESATPAMDNVLDMVKALVERQRTGFFSGGTPAAEEPSRTYPADRPFES
jgi:hypothetical protein